MPNTAEDPDEAPRLPGPSAREGPEAVDVVSSLPVRIAAGATLALLVAAVVLLIAGARARSRSGARYSASEALGSVMLVLTFFGFVTWVYVSEME